MLSKGGKKRYFCPQCHSVDIYNNSIPPGHAIIYISDNYLICNKCHYFDHWTGRGNISNKHEGTKFQIVDGKIVPKNLTQEEFETFISK